MSAAVGFDCEVVLPSTHDTASAIAALPSDDDDTLYISSGTWSLMGVERTAPNCSTESMDFTNEGGYDHRYRYLNSIMGLWIIQSVRRELGKTHSFAQLCALAEKESILSVVDCNDSVFLAPYSMTDAIRDCCRETGQAVPDSAGQLAAVIYNSLAACYAATVSRIEQITGKCYDAINIVGGGSNADYLNRLTAAACGKRVLAGPDEASAIGNLLVQMISAGEFDSLQSARRAVKNSFDIKESLP